MISIRFSLLVLIIYCNHEQNWYIFINQLIIFGGLYKLRKEKIINNHKKINYIEFPAKDIEATKEFFTKVFEWTFIDYGPEYTAFSNSGIDGGFFKSDLSSSTKNGSALIVFYSKDLEQTLLNIENADGSIIEPIFSFPGGRRFHFSDPNGNEYAVWSDINNS